MTKDSIYFFIVNFKFVVIFLCHLESWIHQGQRSKELSWQGGSISCVWNPIIAAKQNTRGFKHIAESRPPAGNFYFNIWLTFEFINKFPCFSKSVIFLIAVHCIYISYYAVSARWPASMTQRKARRPVLLTNGSMKPIAIVQPVLIGRRFAMGQFSENLSGKVRLNSLWVKSYKMCVEYFCI